jgi:hypothetical protein
MPLSRPGGFVQKRGIFHGAYGGLRAFRYEWLKFRCVAPDHTNFFALGEQGFSSDPACVSCGSSDYDHGGSFGCSRIEQTFPLGSITRDQMRELFSGHRDFYAGLFREGDGFGIAGVHVARDADTGIVGQDALNALAHFFRAISDCHLTSV